MNQESLTKAKSLGFSARQIAHLTGTTDDAIRGDDEVSFAHGCKRTIRDFDFLKNKACHPLI